MTEETTLENPSDVEHALVLEGSRKLRGRWRTAVRRIERENKADPKKLPKTPPTFAEFLWQKHLEATYSKRFEVPTRQTWVNGYMTRVLALPDQPAFHLAFGTQLSKFTDGKTVIVRKDISHSDRIEEQDSLWFTTKRLNRR